MYSNVKNITLTNYGEKLKVIFNAIGNDNIGDYCSTLLHALSDVGLSKPCLFLKLILFSVIFCLESFMDRWITILIPQCY